MFKLFFFLNSVFSGQSIRWASKKAGGSTRNTKNKTPGKRLGLKCGNGELNSSFYKVKM